MHITKNRIAVYSSKTQTAWSSVRHSCFVFGRRIQRGHRVQISARKPAILPGIFRGYPWSPQAISWIATTASFHILPNSFIIVYFAWLWKMCLLHQKKNMRLIRRHIVKSLAAPFNKRHICMTMTLITTPVTTRGEAVWEEDESIWT